MTDCFKSVRELIHLPDTVMYIPAVPYTAQNAAYVSRQKEHFLRGIPPPDFPQWDGEGNFTGRGISDDIADPKARKAMGFTES